MKPPKILSTKEAAEYCGISVSTLQRLHNRGDFAPRLEISVRRVGYYEHVLQKWLDSRQGSDGLNNQL